MNFGLGYPSDGIATQSAQVNLVNNIWKPGPNGVGATACVQLGPVGGAQTKLYVEGNRTPTCPSGGCTSNAWNDMGFSTARSSR